MTLQKIMMIIFNVLIGELIADDERAAMIDAACSAIDLLETINQEKVVKQLGDGKGFD